jgi:COP9 signalosome complex subunit 2
LTSDAAVILLSLSISSNHYAGLIESDELKEALQGFQQVLTMEGDKGEWGFKALKQIVKLHFRLGNHPAMLSAYKDLLAYANCSGITRNAAEKKINSVLDFISSQSTDSNLLQDFYGLTLSALAEAKNERLWFKTNVKLANLWFSLKRTHEAATVLKELHAACQDTTGGDDQRKGTQLLEVYALQIQLHTEQRNARELKELYRKALAIESAIPHPRIMGVIRECGGKMHTLERAWADAATDFFEAFKSYDEAGSAARTRCLRYLVLTNMLMESQVDPFDSQEARPYRSDPEVAAMTSLVEAYQSGDIKAFEQVVRTNRAMILDDPFVSPYVDDLKRNVRTQVVLRAIAPYTRVKLDFVAKQLNIPVSEVEQLLIGLILDGKIAGRIDQLQQVLELDKEEEQAETYAALSKWAEQVNCITTAVVSRLNI